MYIYYHQKLKELPYFRDSERRKYQLPWFGDKGREMDPMDLQGVKSPIVFGWELESETDS